MKQNIKICFPLYKIIYSLCFIIILSLIRGISYYEEIGPAIDTNIALLAIVFCADTYVMERNEKRWELFSLYTIKKRAKAIVQRQICQILYLCVIASVGYFCFIWQQPHKLNADMSVQIYVLYLIAVISTILFWSMLVMTASNICKNHWYGIAICVAIWFLLNSAAAKTMLGDFNIFAYSLNNANNVATDYGWLAGKGIGVFLAVIMCGSIPYILKKRG